MLFQFLRTARGQLFKLFERIGCAAVPRGKFVGDDLEPKNTGLRLLIEPVMGTADFGKRRPLFGEFALLAFYLGPADRHIGKAFAILLRRLFLGIKLGDVGQEAFNRVFQPADARAGIRRAFGERRRSRAGCLSHFICGPHAFACLAFGICCIARGSCRLFTAGLGERGCGVRLFQIDQHFLEAVPLCQTCRGGGRRAGGGGKAVPAPQCAIGRYQALALFELVMQLEALFLGLDDADLRQTARQGCRSAHDLAQAADVIRQALRVCEHGQ